MKQPFQIIKGTKRHYETAFPNFKGYNRQHETAFPNLKKKSLLDLVLLFFRLGTSFKAFLLYK